MPLPSRKELETRYGQMVAEQQAREAAAARQISQEVGGAVRGFGLGVMDQVRDFRNLAQKGGQIAGNYINDIAMMRDPTRNLPGYTDLAAIGEAATDPQTYINMGKDIYRQATGGSESLGRLIGQNINPFRLPGGVAKREIFIGKNARTWDAAAAKRAVEMETAGHDPETIWRETGTFRGPDKQLRQEISDVGASAVYTHLPPSEQRLSLNALQHPELMKAYPEMQYITQFGLRAPKSRGTLEQVLMPDDSVHVRMMTAEAPTQGELKSVLLHEFQHAVQANEDFARGGTAKEFAMGPMFSQKAKDLNFDLGKSLTGSGSVTPEEVVSSIKYGDPEHLLKIVQRYGFNSVDEAKDYLIAQSEKRTPHGQYQRLAGEAEARATQKRMEMTPEQRRATFPYKSYDVPISDLIVRRY